MAAVSAEGVAEALETLFRDPGLRNEVAAAGYRQATQPQFRWETVTQQWQRVFTETLADRQNPL